MRRTGTSWRSLALAAVVGMAAILGTNASPVWAVTYTFVKIAEPSDIPGAASVSASVAIDASGKVAFLVMNDQGHIHSIRAGSGGALSLVAAPVAPASVSGNGLRISPTGTVAFFMSAGDGAGTHGIYTGAAGVVTPVYESNSFGPAIADLFSINASGVIAFHSGSSATGGGLFTGDGGPTSPVFVDSSTLLGNEVFGYEPQINAAGSVAFAVINHDFANNISGIAVNVGGTVTPVVTSEDPPAVRYFSPKLNDAGVVGFLRVADGDADTAPNQQVMNWSGGALTPIVGSGADGFTQIVNLLGLNNSGRFLFQAFRTGGGIGVYTGPAPFEKVIEIGDPLLGSTLTNFIFLGLGTHMNDSGQVVFLAFLADGRQVLVRADPVTAPSDLTVTSLTAPAIGGAGRSLTIGDITKNLGPGAAGTTKTKFVLSVNATPSIDDIVLGFRTVGPLDSGESESGSTGVTIPPDTPTGKYFVIAVAEADNLLAETKEGNNKRSKAIKIGPDLAIGTLKAPLSADAGAVVNITLQTKNAGGGDAQPSTSRVYFSANNTVEPGIDAELTSHAVSALAPGQSSSSGPVAVILPAVVSGQYFLIAVVDADGDNAETNEANNVKVKAITIR